LTRAPDPTVKRPTKKLLKVAPMHYVSIRRCAGHWPKERASGALTLDFDPRHRWRIRLTTDQGEDILLNLPEAVAMADGDGMQLEDRRWLKVQATSKLIGKSAIRIPINLYALAGIWEIDIYRLRFEGELSAFDPTM